ncbi:hypothetical protein DPEC_G00289890 [Dallia pectoralis]|uniref:Uncharacterized protein n=1 Tax=Dallia pectoralis TaxID=75939 RepID=A0ACC2FHJ8_DALPE|nr:hypothetical protein DPEC_G00289890 [Dallia pectoralis]
MNALAQTNGLASDPEEVAGDVVHTFPVDQRTTATRVKRRDRESCLEIIERGGGNRRGTRRLFFHLINDFSHPAFRTGSYGLVGSPAHRLME